jgi:phosphoglycerate dehydrogenase-like enzyme
MSEKPVVVCVEFLPAAMRELVTAQKPQELDLVFVDTSNEEERIEKARNADYIICSMVPVSAAVIEASPKLKLVQKFGIGVDKIDLKAAERRGVPVCIAAGVNAIAVAEHTITLILGIYKRLCVSNSSLPAGKWLKWELRMGCYELWQKTVGLIGAGNIGSAVGKRLYHGFECRVLYYDIVRRSPETEAALGLTFASQEEILRQSDIVSLHVPLTPETRGLIGAKELAAMKPNAILINCARGAVVDEPALIEALRKGTIAGAGVDVFAKEPPDKDNPLFTMENVLVTPHNGGGTVDTMKRIVAHSFENVLRIERGEPLPAADIVKA